MTAECNEMHLLVEHECSLLLVALTWIAAQARHGEAAVRQVVAALAGSRKAVICLQL